MLLKEQALKRFQSQFKFEHKKGHRRTKSLDDDWDPETETNKARNDKITDKDRVRADEDEGEAKEAGSKDRSATTDGKEGGGKGEREGLRSPYLMMRRDREREKDKEKEKEKKEDKDDQHQQRHKDGRSWEKDFLAGYARLKQHYTSKLQTGDGGQHQHQPPPAGSSTSATSASTTTPPTIKRGSWWEDHAGQHQQTYLSGMPLDTGSSEWAAAPEDPFTYYDISPTSKVPPHPDRLSLVYVFAQLA